jgi:hypothetical protein
VASIVCPSCTLAVPLDDVDLSTKLAKCRRCESVFDFRAQVRTPQEDARRRRELVPPAGYSVLHGDLPDASRAGYRDGTTARAPTVIERRWWTWRSVLSSVLLGVVCVWSGGVELAILQNAHHDVSDLVGGSICALPGLLALGALASSVLNRSRVTIDDAGIVVRHGPIPWLGTRSIASPPPRTLHVASRRVALAPSDTPIVYDVIGETPKNPRHVVVPGLPTIEGARFVARVIAERLSLPDPD